MSHSLIKKKNNSNEINLYSGNKHNNRDTQLQIHNHTYIQNYKELTVTKLQDKLR